MFKPIAPFLLASASLVGCSSPEQHVVAIESVNTEIIDDEERIRDMSLEHGIYWGFLMGCDLEFERPLVVRGLSRELFLRGVDIGIAKINESPELCEDVYEIVGFGPGV